MKNVQQTIEEQGGKISDTNSIFQTVEENIKYAINGIKDIKEQTEVLNDTRSQTVGTVRNVAAIAQENAAGTEETASFTDKVTEKVSQVMDTINEVKTVADKLEAQVSVFHM